MVARTAGSRKHGRTDSGAAERRGEVDAIARTPDARLLSFIESLSPARALFAVCLVCFLAYANSLGGEFVFDDTEQIVENQNLRSWDNLGKAFTTHVWAFREQSQAARVPPPLPYYRPLFTVMLTAEYHLFGLRPQGWHLVSLLLHILCAAGVFYVILAASRRKTTTALFASLLFAAHPVHAESVSWISGMTDPLFGLFFLASLYFYLKARELNASPATARRALALSLALFLVATFAKETALSLVLLVFGYAFIETSDAVRSRLLKAAKQALPYFGVALIYLAARYAVLGDLMWKNPQASDRPFTYTLLTLPFVLWSYASHLVWPIGLSVTYDTRFVIGAASMRFLLPAGGLALAAAMLFVLRKRISSEVCRALLLTIVPLLPVLNLGQVSREEYLVFDHYLYLPVAGLCWLVAIGISRVVALERQDRSRLRELLRPAATIPAFAVLVLLLTAAAARENRPWADSYSLWSNAARVRPNNWAAHYNAGLALLDAKRFEEARRSLQRSAELKSDEGGVFDALGRAADGMGDRLSAVDNFKRAIALDPEMFESYNNLGTVFFHNNDYTAAEANFTAALRLRPASIPSRFNLGLCYARQGRHQEAARAFERIIQIAGADAEAYYQLGLAYENSGRDADAAESYRRGLAAAESNSLREDLRKAVARLQAD